MFVDLGDAEPYSAPSPEHDDSPFYTAHANMCTPADGAISSPHADEHSAGAGGAFAPSTASEAWERDAQCPPAPASAPLRQGWQPSWRGEAMLLVASVPFGVLAAVVATALLVRCARRRLADRRTHVQYSRTVATTELELEAPAIAEDDRAKLNIDPNMLAGEANA